MVRLISTVVYIVILIMETLISIRFVFKLVNASSANAIVSFVYSVSDILIKPFVGIVTTDLNIAGFWIDVDALIALVVYMIVAFAVAEIVKIIPPPPIVRS